MGSENETQEKESMNVKSGRPKRKLTGKVTRGQEEHKERGEARRGVRRGAAGRIRYIGSGAGKGRAVPLAQAIMVGRVCMCCEDSEDGGRADGRRTATPGPRVGQEGADPTGPDPKPPITQRQRWRIIPYRNRDKPTKWGRAREGSSLPAFEARRRRAGPELLPR